MLRTPDLLNPKPTLPKDPQKTPPQRPAAFSETPLPEDRFEGTGTLEIRPEGKRHLRFFAKVDQTGQITPKPPNGSAISGTLQRDGRFQLSNDFQGNVFNHPFVSFTSDTPKNNDLPFFRTLRAAERLRAVKGSEIGLIRNELTSKGLDGAGITVGILDGTQDKDGKLVPASAAHANAVSQIINDPVWGVAPAANVEQLGMPFRRADVQLEADTPQALTTKLTKDYVSMYANAADQLQAVLSKGDPALRVINITVGLQRAQLYKEVLTIFASNPKSYPVLEKEIFDPAHRKTSKEKFQALVNYIDQTLDHSPEIRQARQHYEEMTRQAAEKGIIIVVAAGNLNNELPIDAQTQPGSDIADLAKSPFVIMAAASNTNQTPGVYENYQVAPFSSRGGEHCYSPTVAAPGMEIKVGARTPGAGTNSTMHGTSAAAPFTCGVIALMLQRNPDLTFEQVKARLQDTAVKSPHYGVADYGAGFLNAKAAVLG